MQFSKGLRAEPLRPANRFPLAAHAIYGLNLRALIDELAALAYSEPLVAAYVQSCRKGCMMVSPVSLCTLVPRTQMDGIAALPIQAPLASRADSMPIASARFAALAQPAVVPRDVAGATQPKIDFETAWKMTSATEQPL